MTPKEGVEFLKGMAREAKTQVITKLREKFPKEENDPIVEIDLFLGVSMVVAVVAIVFTIVIVVS